MVAIIVNLTSLLLLPLQIPVLSVKMQGSLPSTKGKEPCREPLPSTKFYKNLWRPDGTVPLYGTYLFISKFGAL